MSSGTQRMLKSLKKFADVQYKLFTARYGQNVSDIFDFPIKLVLSPFTLAFDIVGSAPRGFGVPELISKLSYVSIFLGFVNFGCWRQQMYGLDIISFDCMGHLNYASDLAVATLGTYDIAFELGKKVICQRNCQTCNGWQALRCTMCRGSGRVNYQVKNYTLKGGEKATAESVADAIVDNRAELLHLPSTMDLHVPLPSKDCPTCDGTGVMGCPECKHKLQVRISADDIMEPPWTAYNVLKKMDYPYEHIVHSMKDPSIAAFWLITLPQIVGGLNYDDDIKQKIWWQYKESLQYDQLRDEVEKRKPGWEHLQEALISVDPVRARDDPVIVKNVPYFKATKALESEVMKLDPPPRPPNWGCLTAAIIAKTTTVMHEHWQELELPLNASSWSKEDLKDPEKLYEMTVLLNAQREIADKILDVQWETKWRQEKWYEVGNEIPLMEKFRNLEILWSSRMVHHMSFVGGTGAGDGGSFDKLITIVASGCPQQCLDVLL
uniref:AtTam37 zinc finger domain-containing protein n=1 Tax=Fagus sylvatica TaxID=28930 RepID=A0A2N9EUI4_FAGSY